jgi:hypothetical protein
VAWAEIATDGYTRGLTLREGVALQFLVNPHAEQIHDPDASNALFECLFPDREPAEDFAATLWIHGQKYSLLFLMNEDGSNTAVTRRAGLQSRL